MIRKFLVPVFEKLLDIIFVFGVLMSAILGAVFNGVIGFIVGLIAGALAIILSLGIIYVLLDIRDLLRSRPSS